jgi:hypothetical protein
MCHQCSPGVVPAEAGGPSKAVFTLPEGAMALARTLRLRNQGVSTMAAVLLVLFPLLLMFNSRLAFVALAMAIVLLYTGRTKSARRPTTQHIDDSSI